jgi:DNA-binding NarL/FixJ family response regulator
MATSFFGIENSTPNTMTLQLIDPLAAAMAERIEVIAPPNTLEITARSTSGKAGWKAVLRRPPELIWLNLDLPDIGGLSLLQKLAAATPAKIIAASEWNTFAQEALQFGAAEFVLLPVSDDVLLQVLGRLLALR